MDDDFDTILASRDGPVLRVVLNRPEARNAITHRMETEILRACEIASADPEIKVVTLRGAGDLFCAGHDLKEAAGSYRDGQRRVPRHRDVPFGMWRCTKPVIVAVHQYVGPVGVVDLCGHADFVLAASGTRFSMEQARFGSDDMSYSPIVFQLPVRVWKKLMMMGGWFTAEQALSWDFVQRVVPATDLEAELEKWAQQLALVPLAQLQSAKANINRQIELMGLLNMAGVQNSQDGHSERDAGHDDFFELIRTVGMKQALEFRSRGIDDDVTKI